MSARGARYIAQQEGKKFYLSDTPCKRGHLSLRLTSTGLCLECRKINEKAIYHANPEKTKAKVKAKYERNKEKIKAMRKEWYQQNIDKERSKAILKSREWRKTNPEHRNALKAKYKADKTQRTPRWVCLEDIVKFYKECPKGYHVDHILPLRGKLVSGLHVIENLQYLPAVENMRKNNKFMPV